MIEPIVENAINHGVLPKSEGGLIEIIIREEPRMLLFTIKDNGIGMQAETVAQVMKRELGEGVGLYNINTRLHKLYGKGLTINSRPGFGTEVSWSIPKKEKKKS